MTQIQISGERKLTLTAGTERFSILGDPHLGKRFNTGVPLQRRGEREELVWKDFEESLNVPPGTTFHVNMGDMFDQFRMPLEIIWRAAIVYRNAASKNPNCRYVVIQGNHDVSRDADKISAFRMFGYLMRDVPNVNVISHLSPMGEMIYQTPNLRFMVIPFHPFKNAKEFAEELMVHAVAVDVVFGHWDIDDFGDTPNMVPWEELQTITKTIITGHVHLPSTRQFGPVQLISTGSMQPYTFAEDPGASIYRTMTLKEVQETDPALLKDKCVRVILEENEELPNIDCLQLIKRKADASQDEEDLNVQLASFDLVQLMTKEMEEVGVTDPEVINFVTTSYNEIKEKLFAEV